MVENLALILAPPNHRYAPFTIHAIKRPLKVASWDDVTKGRTLRVASMRYGSTVIQSGGVYLISNC